MLNHLVFNENMTSWLLWGFFSFFHMANWKMWLFDLYFNYTPSDLSPLHSLSRMNLESKPTLIFTVSLDSQKAKKKNPIKKKVFTFLWFTCGDLQKLTKKKTNQAFSFHLPMRGETAWLCNHPLVHCSSLASCFFHVIAAVVAKELFHFAFHVAGIAIIE